ncbi:MAG: TetR/AcrR family transcriptional regulator [Anaerolineae bacterium]
MSPRTKEQTAHVRQARRRQLLDAARQVFSQKGFSATNVSDVAAAAGVSQGTIYLYFDSKDDLFMATFEAWIETCVYQAYAESDLSAETAAGWLRAFADSAAQMMATSAEFLPVQMEFWSHLLRNEAIRERFRQLFAELRTFLGQIIQAGIDGGEFRPVDAEALAAIAIAVYDGLILQWLADPEELDWERTSRTLVKTLLNGLLAG